MFKGIAVGCGAGIFGALCFVFLKGFFGMGVHTFAFAGTVALLGHICLTKLLGTK